MRRRLGRARNAAAVLTLAVAMLLVSGVSFTRGQTQEARSEAPSRSVVAGTPAMATGADLTSVVAGLQQRLRRLPGDYSGWASLGTAYVQQARITGNPTFYAKADSALARSLEVRPRRNAAALTGMASLAAARHDFAGALRYAERAAALNPYSATNQGVLSDALIELGRYDEAFEALQRMVDLKPGVPSLTRVSYAWELRGELEGARQALDRAADMAVTPADASYALLYQGELAWNVGDVDGAEKAYAEGLRRDPGAVALLVGMAKVAAARGDADTAVAGYAEAVSRSPQPAYLIAYAELLTALGRDAEAAAQSAVIDATIALFVDQGVNVDLELALYNADHGRPAEALAAAEAEWGKRQSIFTADAYAWALHVNGRNAEALEHARTATALGMRNALFDYHRGMIEASLGEDGAARTSLRRALETNPNFSPLHAPLAEAALAELAPA